MKIYHPVPNKLSAYIEIPDDWLSPNETPNPFSAAPTELHRYGENKLCCTESRGYKTPGNMDLRRIVVDASEGFIPLWEANRTLHYRFNQNSMRYFQNPDKAKAAILALLGDAIMAWGDSAPITFKEDADTYDFEIFMNRTDDGDDETGYVLASAFFPASGRDRLTLYPKMFAQSRQEQIETLIHEVGHIFGLRHFFALDLEKTWPGEVYGVHSKFSIMNYGGDSFLTEQDRADLKKLYEEVWSGKLLQINRTPIVKIKPYHDLL
ncbi:MAG: matrixin family metalloprotease [Pseudomonadota bacterium]